MLLTEYDENRTMKAEYYAGMRNGFAEAQARYQDELAAKDAALATKDDEIALLKAQLADAQR